MMAHERLRRQLKFWSKLTRWSFGVYLVLLAIALPAMFLRPAWMFVICGISIGASLLFALLMTLALRPTRRIIKILGKQHAMVCPCCLLTLDNRAASPVCPRCAITYSLEELQWTWAGVLIESSLGQDVTAFCRDALSARDTQTTGALSAGERRVE